MSLQQIEQKFHTNWKKSSFSNDFLENLKSHVQYIPKDFFTYEQISQYILNWDERVGYNDTPEMLNKAIRGFVEFSNTSDYNKEMQNHLDACNNGDNAYMVPIRGKRTEIYTDGHKTRMNAEDHVKGLISQRSMSYIFNTPIGRTDESQQMQGTNLLETDKAESVGTYDAYTRHFYNTN